jgi:hypothetical protein
MGAVMVKWKEPYSTARQKLETPFWASNAAFYLAFPATVFRGNAAAL